MAKTNDKAAEAMKAKLKEMFKAGHFPDVEYKEETGCVSFHSYSMFAYSRVWTRVAKLADCSLKAKGYPDGVFTSNRKNRNSAFLSAVSASVAEITPDKVLENPEDKFRSWMD